MKKRRTRPKDNYNKKGWGKMIEKKYVERQEDGEGFYTSRNESKMRHVAEIVRREIATISNLKNEDVGIEKVYMEYVAEPEIKEIIKFSIIRHCGEEMEEIMVNLDITECICSFTPKGEVYYRRVFIDRQSLLDSLRHAVKFTVNTQTITNKELVQLYKEYTETNMNLDEVETKYLDHFDYRGGK